MREFGYAWDEVHDEAEVLEHAISDRFLDKVAERLGEPRFDPHGDAIPDAAGRVPREPFVLLPDAEHPATAAGCCGSATATRAAARDSTQRPASTVGAGRLQVGDAGVTSPSTADRPEARARRPPPGAVWPTA